MTELFNRVYDNLVDRRNRILEGKINCIPFGLPRFEEQLPGVEKRTYYQITASTKIGKCFAKGTKVIKFNGDIESVENIKEGDLLLGPDSTPRLVQGLNRGEEELFKIEQFAGDDFIVNKSHILYLEKYTPSNISNYKKVQTSKRLSKKEYVEITVEDFLKLSDIQKKYYKLVQSDIVKFDRINDISIDPYFYGLWLGDGDTKEFAITSTDKPIIDYLYTFAKQNKCKIKSFGKEIKYGKIRHLFSQKSLLKAYGKNETLSFFNIKEAVSFFKDKNINTREEYISRSTKKEKPYLGYIWRWEIKRGESRKIIKEVTNFQKDFINVNYLKNTVENRFKLLAGIIDSDGHKVVKNNSYEITFKQESLIKDVQFLARSLGLRAIYSKKYVKKYNKTYYTLRISGDNCRLIPVLLKRKKCTKESPKNLTRRFKITSVGNGEYYGFTVDKDNLFLLQDFTIVHNTQITDFLFMYKTLLYAYENQSQIRLKIFYFSLEMSKEQKYQQMLCFMLFVFSKGKIRIDSKNLRSTKNGVSQEILDTLKEPEYQNFFKFFEKTVVFIDDIRNPFGIYDFCRKYANLNGVQHKKTVKFTNNDNESYEQEIDDFYEPNDPEEYVEIIVDHMALLTPEKNGSVRDAMIKLSSEYFIKLRNKYNYIPIAIVQQAASQESNENEKYNKLKPTLDGYGDIS